jgi:tetratricopeptide (TPR) repeat protein
LIRPVYKTHGETYYGFPDLGLLRQADSELADGATFRTVLKTLLSARSGQLAFDFRLDANPAKIVELKPREIPPLAALMDSTPSQQSSSAEQYFIAASILDDGDPANQEEAAIAYRRALEIDPYLVPALINLANIHYARDEMAEAQALYERATALEPDVFEAHYNLGNIYHDLGLYPAAQRCYREALRLNPTYADAHFYLAVTLEKNGQSQDARPHWKAYQQLAPNGEWVELAKEFSD